MQKCITKNILAAISIATWVFIQLSNEQRPSALECSVMLGQRLEQALLARSVWSDQAKSILSCFQLTPNDIWSYW